MPDIRSKKMSSSARLTSDPRKRRSLNESSGWINPNHPAETLGSVGRQGKFLPILGGVSGTYETQFITMLFDSPAYFVFLIPVVLAYWRLNRRHQNIFLLLASYFFYGWWDCGFLALMIGSTTVGILISHTIAPILSDAHRTKRV